MEAVHNLFAYPVVGAGAAEFEEKGRVATQQAEAARRVVERSGA